MARSASSLVHTHLNALAEFLHAHRPKQALNRFSKYLTGQSLDIVSTNAVRFVIDPEQVDSVSDLLSRAQQVKNQVRVCNQHLAEIAGQKVRNRSVLVHPLNVLGASVVQTAKNVRYLQAVPAALQGLSNKKLQVHHPLSAQDALYDTDLLLLEPKAITYDGMVGHHGSSLLVELAHARGIPVYALGTSLHASSGWEYSVVDEYVPSSALTGVLSEHGIYEHKEFLGRVKKTFPWLL